MKHHFLCRAVLFMISMLCINTAYSQDLIPNETCDCEDRSNFFTSYCEGGVKDAYRYVSLGVGPAVFVPNVGIGYRERYSHLGWDTALSFSTIGYVHQLGAQLIGHYYFNPAKQNSAYAGLGFMGSAVFDNRGKGGGTLSPDFVIGKQLCCGAHFIEMHVAIPTVWMESRCHESVYFPFMYIKYGMAF